jgi:hypothetical protein
VAPEVARPHLAANDGQRESTCAMHRRGIIVRRCRTGSAGAACTREQVTTMADRKCVSTRLRSRRGLAILHRRHFTSTDRLGLYFRPARSRGRSLAVPPRAHGSRGSRHRASTTTRSDSRCSRSPFTRPAAWSTRFCRRRLARSEGKLVELGWRASRPLRGLPILFYACSHGLLSALFFLFSAARRLARAALRRRRARHVHPSGTLSFFLQRDRGHRRLGGSGTASADRALGVTSCSGARSHPRSSTCAWRAPSADSPWAAISASCSSSGSVGARTGAGS